MLPDGRLASCGDDHTVRLWDPARGAETARLKGHDDLVLALAALPDGRLASGGSSGGIRLWKPVRAYLWNPAGFDEAAHLAGDDHKRDTVTALAALPDGRLASGCANGTIRLWDPARGVETVSFAGHDGPVWALAVLPDGRLASGGNKDGTIRLWDPARGAETARLEGHDDLVLALAVLPDGRLASGGAGGIGCGISRAASRPRAWRATVAWW